MIIVEFLVLVIAIASSILQVYAWIADVKETTQDRLWTEEDGAYLYLLLVIAISWSVYFTFF